MVSETYGILDEMMTLDDITTEQFRRNGFIKIKDVLTPEALNYFEEVTTLAVIEKYNREEAFSINPDLYAKAFQQISNIWEWCEPIRELVFSKRLASLATQLMGTKGVRLYHDQALYKEAGGGITPWHCDQVYWPLSNENTVTAWIPFQDTPMEMGPLGFSKGSHLKKMGREFVISDESEKIISKQVKKLDYFCEPFQLGEVSFHYGFTMHNAPANNTDQARKVMTIIYMDSEMKLIEPKTEAHRADHQRWLPKVKPGELCNSNLNPVIFSI